jgi:DNA-binding HxlR family transcriptional regulator
MTENPPSLFAQLTAAAEAAAQAKAEAHQPPRRHGMLPGSTTARVLTELRGAYPKPLRHGELMQRVGASRGAICWAVRYLQAAGLIEGIQRPNRPPYLLYRAILEERDDA